MSQYLLTVEEGAGGHVFNTKHLIEAEDVQMVKYHYHRTLKDWGYTNAWGVGNKHSLQRDNLGADLVSVRKLDRPEWDILSEYLPKWQKV